MEYLNEGNWICGSGDQEKVWVGNKYENHQPIGTAEARHLEEYAHRGIRSMRRRLDNKIIMGKHSEKEQL